MQIPNYEKKTTPQSQPVAQPRLSSPAQEAFGGLEADAHARFGENIRSLGQMMQGLSEQQAQIKEKRFNAFVDAQREAYRANRPNSQDSDKDRAEFYQTLENKGREMLGDGLFSGWKKRNQVLVDKYELDDAMYQTQKKRNETLLETQEALDEYTHLQVFGANDRTRQTAAQVAQGLLSDAASYATPEQIASLKERHRQQAGMAAFLYDSNQNAAEAARKLQKNDYNFTPLEKARAMDSLASAVRGGGVQTSPEVYVSLEERAKRGEDVSADANLRYVSGALTLADRDKLLKTQEEIIPSTLNQAKGLIEAKFSTGDLDANFGFVKHTQKKALDSFYSLFQANPNATQADIMGMAERVIDEYQKTDNDTIATTLPVPSGQGFRREDMMTWSVEKLDGVINTILQQIDSKQLSEDEGAYQVQQFRQWRPYIEYKKREKPAPADKGKK